MRAAATTCKFDVPVFDIVGTGGDKAGSFNISTTSALVIAAGGVKVAKHGNRAASSQSSTAGVQRHRRQHQPKTPRACRKLPDQVGLCFFFAQNHHPAMKYVGGIRRELGIRTVFNILGPLTNPGSLSTFLLGVYNSAWSSSLAQVLDTLGVRRGMVVHGLSTLDELSTACEAKGLRI